MRCPRYAIDPTIVGVFRCERCFDAGTLGLDDLDLWHLEAMETLNAERMRAQKERASG